MGYTTELESSKRGKKGEITIEQALDKIYIVKANGKRSQHIILPGCLFGKRVKLSLVEDSKFTGNVISERIQKIMDSPSIVSKSKKEMDDTIRKCRKMMEESDENLGRRLF